MVARALLVVLLVGCGRRATVATGDPPPPELVERSGGADDGSPGPAGGSLGPAATPQELFASCEGRVEQPEQDGECASDGDCVRAGCSSEVCTSRPSAADIMTTCEILPCFDVLDACGCVQGRCRWSLKAAIPSPALPPLLPR